MKKIVGLIFIMLILFVTISNVAKAETIGVVTTETVRLRREANTSSSVLELIGEGTELEILGEEDGWYKVKYENLTGYVSSDYVEITSTDTTTVDDNSDEDDTDDDVVEEVPDAEDNTATDNQEDETSTVDSEETEFVLSADATLRLIPCFTSKNISSIPSGTNVTVIDTLGKWVKITDGTTTGWVVRQNV